MYIGGRTRDGGGGQNHKADEQNWVDDIDLKTINRWGNWILVAILFHLCPMNASFACSVRLRQQGGLRTTHTAPPSHLGRDQAADLTIILNAEDRRQLTRGGLLPSLASSQGPVAAACLRTCFIVTGKTTDPGKPGALSGGSVQQHARAHLMKPLWEAAARRQPSPRPISVHCSPYRRFVGTAPRSSGGGIAALFKFLCGKNRRAQRASLRATSHEIIIGSLWAEMSFFRWSAS